MRRCCPSFSIVCPCLLQAMKAMKVMKAKAVRAMPKSGIAAQVAESTGLKKSEVAQVLSNLADIGAAEVKKTGRCC